MSKERFFLKGKLPEHIKAIHVEYSDNEMQTFNFENKPKNQKSRVKAPLIFDGLTVHTDIVFAPSEQEYTPYLTIEKNGTEQPN